ncbi:MAG: hypothetical protein GY811_16125 [Myxococcales bacterium]|nr:hypothetical protein [Myxococcales bacterium]
MVTEGPSLGGVAAAIARGLLVVCYPVLIYVGLRYWSPRSLALMTLALVTANLFVRMSQKTRKELMALLPATGTIVLLATLSASLNNATFILFTPALVNVSLLLTFALTLRKNATPLIERFARMQHDDLSEGEQRWCRNLTLVWSGFFVANGLAIVALALLAPLSWWALYTGALSYGLVGLLGAGEYILRKYRFGRFSSKLHDRVLARLLQRGDAIA